MHVCSTKTLTHYCLPRGRFLLRSPHGRRKRTSMSAATPNIPPTKSNTGSRTAPPREDPAEVSVPPRAAGDGVEVGMVVGTAVGVGVGETVAVGLATGVSVGTGVG